MIHIKEMASDEITEDEMTQRFEKVENQNADCKFQSHFIIFMCIIFIFVSEKPTGFALILYR